MKDPRIGQRCELHPATDRWMMGDRYGRIVAVSKGVICYLDPKDPRNGHVFTVLMDKSGKRIHVSEGNINQVF